MCPKDDPINYLTMIGLLVLGVVFAFAMNKAISILKAKIRARRHRLFSDEPTLDFHLLGKDVRN